MTIAQQSFPSPQSWKGEEIHIIPLVPSSRNKPIERKKRIDLKNMRVLFPLSFYWQFHSGRQLFFFFATPFSQIIFHRLFVFSFPCVCTNFIQVLYETLQLNDLSRA